MKTVFLLLTDSLLIPLSFNIGCEVDNSLVLKTSAATVFLQFPPLNWKETAFWQHSFVASSKKSSDFLQLFLLNQIFCSNSEDS